MQTGYFMEFEFESGLQRSIYYFPLHLHTEDEDLADTIFAQIKQQLNAHGKVRHSGKTKVYAGLNSERIAEYAANRMSGKLETINLSVWEFSNYTPDTQLDFEDNLRLAVESTIPQYPTVSIATGTNLRYPVQVMIDNNRADWKEFLVVNLVMPKKQDNRKSNSGERKER